MLLIYYNINNKNFYQVYKDFAFFEIGSINGFNHLLVQVICYKYNRFYNILSIEDYDIIKFRLTKRYVIKRLIRFLNKRLKG